MDLAGVVFIFCVVTVIGSILGLLYFCYKKVK